MNHNRIDGPFGYLLLEYPDGLRGQRRRVPSAGIAGENLHGGASQIPRPIGCLFNPSSDGNMQSQAMGKCRHSVPSTNEQN
jgi:hypothetical protein